MLSAFHLAQLVSKHFGIGHKRTRLRYFAGDCLHIIFHRPMAKANTKEGALVNHAKRKRIS